MDWKELMFKPRHSNFDILVVAAAVVVIEVVHKSSERL